jgi:hypothetical protein
LQKETALIRFPREYLLNTLSNYRKIKRNIEGAFLMGEAEATIIACLVGTCEGDHLEIGSAFGGSALLASFANPNKKIVMVDPLDGFKTVFTDKSPDFEMLLRNVRMFYPDENPFFPHLVKSDQFFEYMNYGTYDTCLIDGDHTYENALNDFKEAAKVTKKYIIMHDVAADSPDVWAAFSTACSHPEWFPIMLRHRTGILIHINQIVSEEWRVS